MPHRDSSLSYYRPAARVEARPRQGAVEATAIKTRELHYDLPPELIAQHPCQPRDAARLMVLHRATGMIEHRVFRDLPAYLTPEDCLVINRTRVLPAKFVARRRTGGRIPGLFLRELSSGKWSVLLTGAGRLKIGERLILGDSRWSMIVLEREERGAWQVAIEPANPAAVVLDAVGQTPLPPYIRREDGRPTPVDRLGREFYQTVYADEPGAIAAPTAGMHFTLELMDRIRGTGVSIAHVLLHVGLGTFLPIEVDDLADHPMHSEWFELPAASVELIQRARSVGGRVIAVGTTSVRVLETAARTGVLRPQSGWTDLLIYPPYRFAATDDLLTNFHLPGSTLLALVFAFAGRENTLRAYACAVAERYRFYSFGDAMLIL